MASDRAEWIQRLVETWNAGDLDGFVAALGPGFEFTPDPSFPDTGTYGGDDLRRWLGDWVQVWDENRLEILGIEERKAVLLVDSRWHLVAGQTRKEVPLRDFTFVFPFEHGNDRPRRAWAFFDREEAVTKADELTG